MIQMPPNNACQLNNIKWDHAQSTRNSPRIAEDQKNSDHSSEGDRQSCQCHCVDLDDSSSIHVVLSTALFVALRERRINFSTDIPREKIPRNADCQSDRHSSEQRSNPCREQWGDTRHGLVPSRAIFMRCENPIPIPKKTPRNRKRTTVPNFRSSQTPKRIGTTISIPILEIRKAQAYPTAKGERLSSGFSSSGLFCTFAPFCQIYHSLATLSTGRRSTEFMPFHPD